MKRVALLVGVEEYTDPEISPLRFARADVTALGEALRDRCRFDRVRVLADRAGRDAPQLPNILDALKDLAPRLDSDDLFCFYFAGHGVELDGQGYLLTPDSRHAFPEAGSLSLSVLRGIFGQLVARRRVLILDACRNSPEAGRGDADNRMGAGISRDIAATARARAGGSVATSLLSACSSGQRAYEWAEEGHGLFTYFLLEGLAHGAWRDESLMFRDLAAYTCRKVSDWCAKAPGLRGPQEPWYEHFGNPEPIILAEGGRLPAVPPEAPPRPKPRPSVRIVEPPKLRVTTVPLGAEVEIDGGSAGRSPVSVELSAGRHRVAVRLEGYQDWDRQIHFEGDADAELPIELQERPRLVEAFFPMTAGEAKDVQRAAAEALGLPLTDQLDCGGGVKLRLILIPPGKFLMGSPEDEEGRDDDEGPQHEVTIGRAFYMGVTPVTQAQYKALTGKKPSDFKGDANPVENVSWEDAGRFCADLTQRTGKIVRLPAEAEWEYACRAGSPSRFSFGDEDRALPLHAWYDGNSDGKTHPVGQKKPNAFGLYDMHGNVWEWCQDWYDSGYYAIANVRDPQGPVSGSGRVLRGGSWSYYPWTCRSAYRRWGSPGTRSHFFGFRVVVLLSSGVD